MGLAACALEKRFLEVSGRGDQLVGEPGIRHEVFSLIEAFKDMLRPCRSLDPLADKQGVFFFNC